MNERSPLEKKDDVDERSRRHQIQRHFYGTVTVGERGQIVIPAQARRDLNIETGDKLLIMGHPDKRGLMLCQIEAMRDFMNELLEGLKIVEAQAAENEMEEGPTSK